MSDPIYLTIPPHEYRRQLTEAAEEGARRALAQLQPVLDRLIERAEGAAQRVLTTEQASRIAGRETGTVGRWIRSGELPATRRGRGYLIDRYDLDAMLLGQQGEGQQGEEGE